MLYVAEPATPVRTPHRTEASAEDRLLRGEADSLTHEQLLSVLLGVPETFTTLLLGKYERSLSRLQREVPAALLNHELIGLKRAARLLASLEFGKRAAMEVRIPSVVMDSTDAVYQYMQPKIGHLAQEEFHVLVLDTRFQLYAQRMVSRGIVNASIVHPREVFRDAIAWNASSIICVHNHPSGDPSPSIEDHQCTANLQSAGKVLGIPVQDHIIIGDNCFVSFAQQGLL